MYIDATSKCKKKETLYTYDCILYAKFYSQILCFLDLPEKGKMLAYLKHDLPAGIAVFLVAIPLCLGISIASGAPLMSGLIAGIIG